MPSLHASKAQESVGGRSPAFQSISPVSTVQGTPDTSELARTLPQKYRRKLMSEEEIELIQVSFIYRCVYCLHLPSIQLISTPSKFQIWYCIVILGKGALPAFMALMHTTQATDS